MSNVYGFQFLQQVEERGPARQQVRGVACLVGGRRKARASVRVRARVCVSDHHTHALPSSRNAGGGSRSSRNRAASSSSSIGRRRRRRSRRWRCLGGCHPCGQVRRLHHTPIYLCPMTFTHPTANTQQTHTQGPAMATAAAGPWVAAARGGDGGPTRTSCLTWWRSCSGRRATGRCVGMRVCECGVV